MSESAGNVRILDEDVRTAKAAARALSVPVGAIANSLVFRATYDGQEHAVLVLTSGAHRAAPDRITEHLGADRIELADPAFVRVHTGQAIGGVAPLGHPRALPTLVDLELTEYDQVWAAAGHPKAVFPTTFTDLVTMTAGRPVDLGG